MIREEIDLANIAIPNMTSATFPIDFKQLTDFIFATVDRKYDETLDIAKEYTDNTDGLMCMLQAVHKLVTNRSLKTRLTKLTNAITPLPENFTIPSDSAPETEDSDAEVANRFTY